jgi:hypothetical protein
MLEVYTSEKVYIIAGPELGSFEGHILIISKALYVLRISGARWHDRRADCMRELDFFSCKSKSDIWMRKKGDCMIMLLCTLLILLLPKNVQRRSYQSWKVNTSSQQRGVDHSAFILDEFPP